MFKKSRSLQVSEKVFELLYNKIVQENLGINLQHDDVRLETFNNCREFGYCLFIWYYNLVIWACETRNSDDIMIVVGDPSKNINLVNMFDRIAYDNAEYFRYGEYEKAVDYIYNEIVNSMIAKRKEIELKREKEVLK